MKLFYLADLLIIPFWLIFVNNKVYLDFNYFNKFKNVWAAVFDFIFLLDEEHNILREGKFINSLFYSKK